MSISMNEQYALRAYREINALENKTGLKHGLTKDELKAISLYIQKDLPKEICQGHYYLKKEATGLARTIEYDPNTKNVFIHLKRKGVQEIGRGCGKVVTQSILYDIRKPAFVALSVLKPTANQKEAHYMDSLKNTPGVISLLAATSHVKERTQTEVQQIVTPLYEKGSLQKFKKEHQLSIMEKACIAKDVMNSLKNLHSREIAHGDVHKGNFLVKNSVSGP